MNSTTAGFPFQIIGFPAKKNDKGEKGGEKINNINIIINHNTWVSNQARS